MRRGRRRRTGAGRLRREAPPSVYARGRRGARGTRQGRCVRKGVSGWRSAGERTARARAGASRRRRPHCAVTFAVVKSMRSDPAADFDEDLGLEHAPQRHAGGGPGLEMIGDGYLPALASGLADAVKLCPARDAGAPRTSGSAGGPRVHRVRAAVDGDGALVGGVARVDRHPAVRVVDDVPLDARVHRPPVHADIGEAASCAGFRLGELRRNSPQLREATCRSNPIPDPCGPESHRSCSRPR